MAGIKLFRKAKDELTDDEVLDRDCGCAICAMGWWPQSPVLPQGGLVRRYKGRKVALCDYHYMMTTEADYLPMKYALKGWLDEQT